MDAQQNRYNIEYNLAVILTTLSVTLDGDVITKKLSIGCDAISRTSATESLLGNEFSLDSHNVDILFDIVRHNRNQYL